MTTHKPTKDTIVAASSTDARKSSLFIEARKVAYTGGGQIGNRSFMITLPKNFSRVLGLQKGGIVSIQLKHFQSSQPYLIVKKIDVRDEGRE